PRWSGAAANGSCVTAKVGACDGEGHQRVRLHPRALGVGAVVLDHPGAHIQPVGHGEPRGGSAVPLGATQLSDNAVTLDPTALDADFVDDATRLRADRAVEPVICE